ncbi:hypothetical protein [Microbacterium invictum]|uniref:Transcriptional regulator, AbiEi antitoxin, Type IV TA system n=1 Tax=Microbacterium invictum TaxID=515415 RepID=A0AA40SPP6_9MICO|nr:MULTISPECIES: hypothetical protein [Microbacterium]MBB4140093.1 hypothetical protein [Microbacterium invictum]
MCSRAEMVRAGWSSRALTTQVRDEKLHRIDRAWYIDTAAWNALWPEERHIMRVVASHARRPEDSRMVYVLCSAAVLHGLPLTRVEPRRVHVAGTTGNGHVKAADPLIARHQVAVPDADIVTIDGIRCTALARTVADMIRFSSEETGIALLDAAIRKIAWHDDALTYDEEAAAAFGEQVRTRLPRGGRGVRRARYLLSIGDGRAQSPGESISRLYLLRLGFAPPRLQVPIAGPHGNRYFVDFGIDDAEAWGEFDGSGKYLDASLRADDETADQVVLEEKIREDWIRGTTNRRFARWMSTHISSAPALGRRLAAFSVTPR